MKLPAKVRVGDVAFCDVRGDRFWAKVIERLDGGGLRITSLTGRPIPALTVKSSQVVGYWRAVGRSGALI